MFRWKTWAIILRMFHEENIVFLTCRAAVFRRKVGLTVVLRWSYGGLMIQVTEKRLELSTYKGTKTRVKHRTWWWCCQRRTRRARRWKCTWNLKILNRRRRRNAQKYIMAQEKDKKKFLRLSALSAVQKTQNTQNAQKKIITRRTR